MSSSDEYSDESSDVDLSLLHDYAVQPVDPFIAGFERLNMENIQAAAPKEERRSTMVVGVSGCTSSGKSLLALLLGSVFDGCKFAFFFPLVFSFGEWGFSCLSGEQCI